MAMVKSLGAALSEGWKGELAVCKGNRLARLAPGLCAMLMAAVAVSVGAVLPFLALAKSVVQGLELGPAELTHAARMFPSVLISLCGTVPLPAAVVARAAPVVCEYRLSRVALALF